jgi:hypothetical protein
MTAAVTTLDAKAKETLDYFAMAAFRAHASWLAAVPPPLFERAVRSSDGRKLMSRWLAFQLQLNIPVVPTLTEAERWLLLSRNEYAKMASALGAVLASTWVRTQVSRQAVARIQQALGEVNFAKVMAAPLVDTDPLLVEVLERATTAAELRNVLEACGVHALKQTLPSDDRKLVQRFRLAFAKRWSEYDALEGMRVDPAFVQQWLLRTREEDAYRTTPPAKIAVGESQ